MLLNIESQEIHHIDGGDDSSQARPMPFAPSCRWDSLLPRFRRLVV